MLQKGDKVKIVSTSYNYKEEFIGTVGIIIGVNQNLYRAGEHGYSLDNEINYYWKESELELVNKYSTVKTTKTEIAGKEIKLLEINNNKSIHIGNEQFNIEQTKELINILNDLTKA